MWNIGNAMAWSRLLGFPDKCSCCYSTLLETEEFWTSTKVSNRLLKKRKLKRHLPWMPSIMTTMSISLEAGRFLFKRKIKITINTYFLLIQKPTVINDMKETETKSSEKNSTNSYPLPRHIHPVFHAVKNSLQPWALVAKLQQWGSGNLACQPAASAICWSQKNWK